MVLKENSIVVLILVEVNRNNNSVEHTARTNCSFYYSSTVVRGQMSVRSHECDIK